MQLFSLHATGSQFLSVAQEQKTLGDLTDVKCMLKKRKQKGTEYPLHRGRELGEASCRTVTSHSL